MDNSEDNLLIQCISLIVVVFLIVLIFITVQNKTNTKLIKEIQDNKASITDRKSVV